MARQKRLFIRNIPVHVLQVGHNQQPCFFDELDYKYYLYQLKKSSEKYDVAVHSFVLMANHIHLLATPANKAALGRMMQSLGRNYVQFINEKYNRSGTLWEGRYKSTLIEPSSYYFFLMSSYIESNPLRSDCVKRLDEYQWSSFQANALCHSCDILSQHLLYADLGNSNEIRALVYRELFEYHIPQSLLKRVEQCTNSGWTFGSENFCHTIESLYGRQVMPRSRGGDRRSPHYSHDMHGSI